MLFKPAIILIFGILSNYLCSLYIFNSDRFDDYTTYMLQGYDNASAAFLGLIPIVKAAMNLFICILVHIVTLTIYYSLNSSFLPNIVKKALLLFSSLGFILFCILVLLNLLYSYKPFFFLSLIPILFWLSYGIVILYLFFKSQKTLIHTY